MKTIRTFLTFLLIFSATVLLAKGGEKRSLQALRTDQAIQLDGVLDEQIWSQANIATDFTQLEPNPGEKPTLKTEVRILYNDRAIYAGAILYDDPVKISRQLFERDKMNNVETDWFGVAFDTYMDGLNGFAFLITPSGVQTDVKFTADGDDDAWDAVWESAVQITDQGWVVEIKIPYSAIRFPDKSEQRWHMQLGRSTFRLQEEAFWNPIDPEVDGFFNQAGILEGVMDIRSPVRFSATPFLALYGENYYDKDETPRSTWGRSINGGMDIRYGISDAFTLDMTLIPDFGQVQSDNEVLNLSPFEVHFDENRQFLTEGTELFSKAGLFYSRRVGGEPLNFYDEEDLKEGEELIKNPAEAQLYNATKISGRTAKGMGLGIFNAVEGREYAVIRNGDGDQRKVRTNPLTNYNVFVVDQNLKNNSYISVINTNVLREGLAYDANVTGTEIELRDKNNEYRIAVEGALSQKYYSDHSEFGHTYDIELGKSSGSLLWELGYSMESHDYDPNDLGFLNNNNDRTYTGYMEYNRYEPFGKFLRMGAGMFSRLTSLHRFTGTEEQRIRDNLFTNFGVNLWWWATTENFWRFNFSTYFQPARSYDYFETRVDGRFYESPEFLNLRLNLRTDTRKKVSLHANFRYEYIALKGSHEKSIDIGPSFRISDKFSLSYVIEIENENNDIGYVNSDDESDIIFGQRDIVNVLNLVNAKYVFNPKMNVNFRLRHNWTKVNYNTFYHLNEFGRLNSTNYNENNNINFNAFTIDATYRWRFAPGSDIFIVWKNSIIGEDEENTQVNYFENFGQLFDHPQRNSLSIKILYYLDYLNIKDAFKRN